MPRVVLTHAVEDLERWLEGKAGRAAAIGAAGTNVTDYVALDGSNKIAVTADVTLVLPADKLMKALEMAREAKA